MACKYTQKVRTSIVISVATLYKMIFLLHFLMPSHFVRFRGQEHLNETETTVLYVMLKKRAGVFYRV